MDLSFNLISLGVCRFTRNIIWCKNENAILAMVLCTIFPIGKYRCINWNVVQILPKNAQDNFLFSHYLCLICKVNLMKLLTMFAQLKSSLDGKKGIHI